MLWPPSLNIMMIFPSFIVYHNIRQHRDNLNLQTISYLKKNYPQYKIGFSDHTIGISAPIVALGLGAEIIEKHITIDRRMKGTDQAGSLGPDGVYRMVRDIRVASVGWGQKICILKRMC